jgi:hypothetical protein
MKILFDNEKVLTDKGFVRVNKLGNSHNLILMNSKTLDFMQFNQSPEYHSFSGELVKILNEYVGAVLGSNCEILAKTGKILAKNILPDQNIFLYSSGMSKQDNHNLKLSEFYMLFYALYHADTTISEDKHHLFIKSCYADFLRNDVITNIISDNSLVTNSFKDQDDCIIYDIQLNFSFVEFLNKIQENPFLAFYLPKSVKNTFIDRLQNICGNYISNDIGLEIFQVICLSSGYSLAIYEKIPGYDISVLLSNFVPTKTEKYSYPYDSFLSKVVDSGNIYNFSIPEDYLLITKNFNKVMMV